MRTLLASILLALPLTAQPAAAQSTNCRPDYLGGYRCSDNYGNYTRVRPSSLGGFNIQQSPSPNSYPSYSPMPCRLMPTQYGVNGYSCQ